MGTHTLRIPGHRGHVILCVCPFLKRTCLAPMIWDRTLTSLELLGSQDATTSQSSDWRPGLWSWTFPLFPWGRGLAQSPIFVDSELLSQTGLGVSGQEQWSDRHSCLFFPPFLLEHSPQGCVTTLYLFQGPMVSVFWLCLSWICLPYQNRNFLSAAWCL